METIKGLDPVKFKYKANDSGEEHLGFIAEDVPALVAEQDRNHLSPMDLTAILTKVVQEQQGMLQKQQETMEAMTKKIEALESAISYSVKGL